MREEQEEEDAEAKSEETKERTTGDAVAAILRCGLLYQFIVELQSTLSVTETAKP